MSLSRHIPGAMGSGICSILTALRRTMSFSDALLLNTMPGQSNNFTFLSRWISCGMSSFSFTTYLQLFCKAWCCSNSNSSTSFQAVDETGLSYVRVANDTNCDRGLDVLIAAIIFQQLDECFSTQALARLQQARWGCSDSRVWLCQVFLLFLYSMRKK